MQPIEPLPSSCQSLTTTNEVRLSSEIRRVYLILLVLLFATIIGIYFLLADVGLHNKVPITITATLFANNSRPIKFTRVSNKTGTCRMTIITWSRLRQTWDFNGQMQASCPEQMARCLYTVNRSKVDESEMLLFHMNYDLALPKVRNFSQKWVFTIRESMANTRVNLTNQQNRYNVTMTFKNGSTIRWPYGECWRLSETDARAARSGKTKNHAKGKTKLAAWFVSNCHTSSRRENYVKELQRHMTVDVYGKCGPLKCGTRADKDCYQHTLQKQYKFYLAFENSLCTDYVTEKLYNVISLHVVPIVLGGADYSRLLPQHSYIDIRDYESPRQLADYLKLLDSNDTLYNAYFDWKQTFGCGKQRIPIACRICEFAHQHRGKSLQPPELLKFWGKHQNCIDARDYYRGYMSLNLLNT